jgi:hypothetical protein
LRAESCRTLTETTDAPARMEFSIRSSTCSDKSRITPSGSQTTATVLSADFADLRRLETTAKFCNAKTAWPFNLRKSAKSADAVAVVSQSSV